VDAVTATHGQRPLDRRVRDDATVAIEDARTGFYMVRTAALCGARASLSGAHLADALGATVALARICHRQGYDADEQLAEVTLDQLVAEHLHVSRERVVRILDQLQRAGVIERHSARFDGARRRPTEIRFTGAAVPFARVDAAAYDAIASAAGRGLLRHLALYVTLVDLAGDQRDEHGGKRRVAVTSYSGLELRSGASLRSVKDIIAALVAWGVLERHARHDANGMTEANRYRLIDLQPASDRGDATAELWSGDRRTVGVPQADDGGATAEQWDGETRTMAVRHPDGGGVRRPAHARATDIQNEQKEQNQTPSGVVEVGEGEGFPGSSDIDALCQRFLSSLDATLGPRRSARLVAGQHDKWRAAASRLLEGFELSRLLAAIDYLRTDTILSGRARTLPEFATCADEAVLRSQAAGQRERPPASSDGADRLSWAAAWAHVRRAVSAFGRDGEGRARQSLAAKDPQLAHFVDNVGWRAICQADPDNPTDLKFAWLAFRRPHGDEEEAA
jgi:hypothetical protein